MLETPSARKAGTKVDGRIADIRDRERVMRLVEDFKPDFVFHAAALKHVPILEPRLGRRHQDQRRPGSVNVADAAPPARAPS